MSESEPSQASPSDEPERRRRRDELLLAVLDLPSEERPRRLAELEPDAALRREVATLLALEDGLGDFLAATPTRHATVRPRPRGTPTTRASALTARGRGAVHRLGRLGSTIGVLFGLPLVLAAELDAVPWDEVRWMVLALAFSALTGAVLSYLCTRPRLPDRALLAAGRAWVVAAAPLLAVGHVTFESERYGMATPLGPHLLLVLLFPLLLPLEPRDTLATAFAAAAAAAVGLMAPYALGWVDAQVPHLPDLLAMTALSPLPSYFVSRRVHRIRDEAARARTLGAYRLDRKIGEGGMSEVWRARHRLLARPAAVKLIRPSHLAGDPARRDQMVERLSREARAMAALGSDHTVRLIDFGVDVDGTFYLAMELLDGVDLGALVRRHGAQPAERVRRLLLAACDSLAEAHAKGLIHRDVKPANLMLCRRGRDVDVVKVLDFGIVRLPENEPSGLTRTGALIGTPGYIAPETLLGGAMDARSDLYSLGCVAYWLLTGRPVFDKDEPMERLAAHLRDEVPRPTASGVALPPDLEAVLLACLAKDPVRRPASADALAELLIACGDSGDWDDGRARAWWAEHGPSEVSSG